MSQILLRVNICLLNWDEVGADAIVSVKRVRKLKNRG